MTNTTPPDGEKWWEQPTAAGNDPSPNPPPQFTGDPTLHATTPPPPAPYPSGAHPTPIPPPAPPVPPSTFPPPASSGWSHPNPGLPGPGFPSPRRSGSKVGWIIGGVVVLVLVLVIGCGIFVVSHISQAAKTNSPSGAAGNYTTTTVNNACDLVDSTILVPYAAIPDQSTHTETAPTEYGGGTLSCISRNKGIRSDDASLHLNVALDQKYSSSTTSEYDSWRKVDTSTTGTGHESGAVTGLGQQGYFTSTERDYSSFTSYDYTIGVHDSNASVKVQLSMTQTLPIDKTAVATAARHQVQQVLTKLKK